MNMAHASFGVRMTSAVENKTVQWKPLDAWPSTQRPTALWPWLAHTGSLTEKLRAVVGEALHVEVLREDVTQLVADDALLLHSLPGTAAHRREVYLCGDQPRIFARTLATAEAARWLDELNTQPLGERVFAQARLQRGAIQVALLEAGQPLFQAASQRFRPVLAALWARRSVLTVQDDRLLIYECFLSEFHH